MVWEFHWNSHKTNLLPNCSVLNIAPFYRTSACCISELGANIAGGKEDEQESGVPSTNSIKSMSAYRNSASTELRSQIENVEEENVRYENKKMCLFV